ncbi:hypothetical protein BDZ89DRAFT_1075656 [Hymenopellis radicata]|nr:hypothetical protein BDZ89DRAFT_1075656 [Hymenopellis radicata]
MAFARFRRPDSFHEVHTPQQTSNIHATVLPLANPSPYSSARSQENRLRASRIGSLFQRCLLRSSVDKEAHLLYFVGSQLLVGVVSVVSAHP